MASYGRKCKVCKMKKKKTKKFFRNFAHLYLGIGWCNLLQIWNVDSPGWGASLPQVWLNSGKWSQSYVGVKIIFFVFLSIYPQGDARASWAARHTTTHYRVSWCTHNLLAKENFYSWCISQIKCITKSIKSAHRAGSYVSVPYHKLVILIYRGSTTG